MRCKIDDRYFNVFFVEIQLKKENQKNGFLGARAWAPKPVCRCPKRPKHVTENPEVKILLLENYSHSSSTLSSKNNRTLF